MGRVSTVSQSPALLLRHQPPIYPTPSLLFTPKQTFELSLSLRPGSISCKKKCFLLGIAQITSPPNPPSPQFGQLVPLFLDVKNDVFARITEPSNDDYDNDVSDNCENNFGTFDDFGVKPPCNLLESPST